MNDFIALLPTLITKIGQHLIISLSALGLGCLIAIPLGVIISRSKRLSSVVIAIASVLQTIPSLALLAMIVPIMGVGRKPAIVALCIYSLLPILRNTFLGVQSVDSSIVDAAKGMGMNPFQQIKAVQVPLAFPVIMSGVRLSTTLVLAWTTLASYIGAGGLGDLIFSGLNNFNMTLILSGTFPIIILAFIIDLILEKVEIAWTPKTERKGGESL
ncbi:ABC transporter permease [Erysipelothrix inopinata]|uniref:ABC transporter permease n=1 Tax=Erysipelothrix inopinata TaxID=225084 RepID=A0A7G9RWK1_9FIRM|nr:ABC transporter permease [Erysipelothrix inopinata]QNN59976.1 ABC transporter permease [Erysipelothrix inopinata]